MANLTNDPTSCIASVEQASMQGGIPLAYPANLASDGESKAISFFVVKYDKTKAGRQETMSVPLSKIYLPVPPELSTGDALDYEEFSAPLLQNIAESANAAVQGRWKEVGTNTLSAMGIMANSALAQDAKYMQSLAGMVVNPRNTNLFKSPKAREYQFTYRFIATSFDESRRIDAIIKRFRYHAYPDVVAGEGVFYVPDIFLIAIKNYVGGEWIENEYMFKPLPCALIGMAVSYNGNSSVAFFKSSGAPVEVTLTLSFVEMELDNKQELDARYNKQVLDVNTITTTTPEDVQKGGSGTKDATKSNVIQQVFGDPFRQGKGII